MAVPFLDATDSVAWAANLNGQSYDDLTFDPDDVGDSGVVVLTLGVSATETPGIGDIATTPLTLTSITTFEGQPSEVGTESLALKPSGTDIHDAHDLNTEIFALSPSGVEGPQYGLVETGSEYLALKPSGVDVLAKQYVDSGTTPLIFGISGHDCYQHPTPEWSLDIFKRWSALPMIRWSVTVSQRWSTAMLVGAVEVPC